MAAEESVHTLSPTWMPKSRSRLWWPKPAPAPLTTPLNSASPLLSATLDCVDDDVFIGWDPRSAHPPLVLLRILGHPAQSVSV